ncbi:uncharacterized protein LOC113307648 [Papaver somniferum]|uniref:uncharacterized protein LOC113307648 n=1 Tax=Papaver somniferum TaxID=3469 RepID=UPI000E6FC121|nr:uncharacterized protein LOC113307648 [Papaver somniferum]
MPAVWNGDLAELTNLLQTSMRLDTNRNLNLQNPAAHQNVPHNLWRYCIIGFFFSLHGANAWHLICALRKIWRIRGGLSVRQAGVEYYLIRFQIYHEFVRAVRQGSRAIMNDIFMMSVWHEDQDIREIILTHVELNITIRGLNLEQLQDFDDIRGFVFNMGEIIAFDPPRLTENGSYAMTVRLTMNVFNTLRENTIADDGRGGLNTLTFEYHDLPHNFCEFCRRLGHKQEDCGQYMQAQNLVQHGYQLPTPPALYPPLHPSDAYMADFMGDADDEFDFLANDNDSSTNNNNSTATNQMEINIHDHDDAISSVTSEELLVKIKKPNSPPFVVNPHQWDEFGFNTPEPFVNPNPYELSWDLNIISQPKDQTLVITFTSI